MEAKELIHHLAGESGELRPEPSALNRCLAFQPILPHPPARKGVGPAF